MRELPPSPNTRELIQEEITQLNSFLTELSSRIEYAVHDVAAKIDGVEPDLSEIERYAEEYLEKLEHDLRHTSEINFTPEFARILKEAAFIKLTRLHQMLGESTQ